MFQMKVLTECQACQQRRGCEHSSTLAAHFEVASIRRQLGHWDAALSEIEYTPDQQHATLERNSLDAI